MVSHGPHLLGLYNSHSVRLGIERLGLDDKEKDLEEDQKGCESCTRDV